jgi:molybdopterin converting factor small subunit
MGRREMALAPTEPVRLSDLLSGTPELSPLLRHRGAYKVAVNHSFVETDTEVHHGDEVAFLPPFSGG